MQTLTLNIELLNYWHASSGMAGSSDIDTAVIRDADGLPYLPGRTLKGLLREACHLRAEFAPNASEQLQHVDTLFGMKSEASKPGGASIPGSISVSDARLSEALRSNLMGNKNAIAHLFSTVSSTKIDKNGLAEDQTLRCIEVALPCRLEAQVNVPDYLIDFMKQSLPLIRELGSHRHRGLGRCVVTSATANPSHS